MNKQAKAAVLRVCERYFRERMETELKEALAIVKRELDAAEVPQGADLSPAAAAAIAQVYMNGFRAGQAKQ